jgi:cyclo(L-tyrosyl-L-tyrosyl) synthase
MEKEKAVLNFVNSESEKLFLLKEHALVGTSPFNSYYEEDNLKKLFSWSLNHFKEVSVFIPDGISAYTLQAIGYSEDKAKRKGRLHDNNLKHKVIRSLVANNFSEAEAESKVVFLSNLMPTQKYLEFHNAYKELYEKDENFKNGCLATSKLVLASKNIPATINSNEALHTAVKYFLAELPIYLNTSEILNVPSSLYVYKDQPADFLSNIYNNNNSPFSKLISSNQGYLAVTFNG